MINKQMKK